MLACRARATEAIGVVAAAAPTPEVKAALPNIMAAAFQVRALIACSLAPVMLALWYRS